MGRLNQLFRKIDIFLFEKLNILKETPQFQAFYSALDTLTDIQRKMVFQAISYTVILSPLLMAGYFFLSNLDLREELEIKQQITRLIYSYKDKSSISSSIRQTALSSAVLKKKDDLLAIVKQVSGISQPMKIENFSYEKVSNTLSITKGTLTFEDLTTKTLTLLIDNIMLRNKIKIARIDIKKDVKLNTLKGDLDLIPTTELLKLMEIKRGCKDVRV